jgi:hypothetical protein
LPPASSAKDLTGGRTQILNVRQIRRINRHPAESDEDSTPESISDSDDWLDWYCDLDNPNDSKDDCAADDESDIEQIHWHRGFGMPTATGCEHRTKCARIGSDDTEVKESG